MRTFSCLLAATLSILAVSSVAAQEIDPQKSVTEQCRNQDEKSEFCKDTFSTGRAPDDAKGAVLDGAPATVVVGVDSETQTAAIQFAKARLGHKLSATVIAGVDKDTGNAEFLGFDGQVGAQKLKVEYNYIQWPEFAPFKLFPDAHSGSFPGAAELDVILGEKLLNCLGSIETVNLKKAAAAREGIQLTELQDVLKGIAKLDLPTAVEIKSYIRDNPSDGPVHHPATPEEKAAEGKIKALNLYSDDSKGACANAQDLALNLFSNGMIAQRDLTPRRTARLFGVNSSVSNKEFSYLDRDLLQAEGKVDKTSSRELPASFGVRFGWVFLTREIQGSAQSSLIFSYNQERGFKEAGKLTSCQPAAGLEDFSAVEACKEIAGAAPTAFDSHSMNVEYRAALSNRMGLAVRGFYRNSDGKPNDFGLEVPLYFLSNKDGDFQGGVTFGWRDQADDITLAVFVGRKFAIF